MKSTWVSDTTRRSRRALLATAAIFYVATMYCAAISSVSSLGLSLSFDSLPVRFFLLVLLAYFGLQYGFHLWGDWLNRPLLQAEIDYFSRQKEAYEDAKESVERFLHSTVRSLPAEENRTAAYNELAGLFTANSVPDSKIQEFDATVARIVGSYSLKKSQANLITGIFQRHWGEIENQTGLPELEAHRAREFEWWRFVFWDWILPSLVVVVFATVPFVSAPTCEPTGFIPFLP